ncbi:MAG: molybdopterin-dependent oxidoreductase [Gammaproteobacteria bacterium]|nr:molybdopterin-dependent oxidoreductase [Gammaproteobacteria bacterium]MDH3466025.1 molybdopterin-dependent oxidoreductase [Gammaproteobacteria bacterium]
MKRRDFLKTSAFIGAGTVAGPALMTGCAAGVRRPGTGELTVSPTICDICFWKCAGIVYKDGGEPWKVVGNPNDLHSRGRLCTRGTAGLGAYLDPDRLKTPLLRVDNNGNQRFKPVSWDEALEFIAARLRKLASDHGPEKLALFSHGSGGGHFKHLLQAYGSRSFVAPSFAQCRGPREVAFKLTYGEGVGSPDRTDMEHSRCIVLIGSHIGENLHNSQVQTFAAALHKKAKLITVDPRFSVPAGKSDYWLPIKPGTDIALLLAWMHVLIQEDLYDRDYVTRYTHGFTELKEHVRKFTPEWAYPITAIPAARIRETARVMAANAPATLIHPGRHVAWYGDDTQRLRAVAILNALLGSWGRPGGYYQQEKVALPNYPIPEYPKITARVQDANRGKYPEAYAGVSTAVFDASIGPDALYKAWIVYGTNLPLTVPGVAGRLQEAADSLDLIVAIDIQPCEVTGYADVILPECTYLERYDTLRNAPERRPSLALRMPAFKPKYDSKPGWWIAKQLGKRLGLGDYFPWKDYTEVLEWQLKQVGSSLAEMKKTGVKVFPRTTPMYFTEGTDIEFNTPTGKIEIYSTQLAKLGFDPLPKYSAHQEPPPDYYRLNYGRAPAHTFGRTQNNKYLFEIMPENVIWVHPTVARKWDLENGRYVRLKNQDGVESNRIRIRVTERIRPDSVFMAHGFGHTAEGLRLASGRGADDAALITNIPHDPIMGASGMRANFVTFLEDEV